MPRSEIPPTSGRDFYRPQVGISPTQVGINSGPGRNSPRPQVGIFTDPGRNFYRPGRSRDDARFLRLQNFDLGSEFLSTQVGAGTTLHFPAWKTPTSGRSFYRPRAGRRSEFPRSEFCRSEVGISPGRSFAQGDARSMPSPLPCKSIYFQINLCSRNTF